MHQRVEVGASTLNLLLQLQRVQLRVPDLLELIARQLGHHQRLFDAQFVVFRLRMERVIVGV